MQGLWKCTKFVNFSLLLTQEGGWEKPVQPVEPKYLTSTPISLAIMVVSVVTSQSQIIMAFDVGYVKRRQLFCNHENDATRILSRLLVNRL